MLLSCFACSKQSDWQKHILIISSYIHEIRQPSKLTFEFTGQKTSKLEYLYRFYRKNLAKVTGPNQFHWPSATGPLLKSDLPRHHISVKGANERSDFQSS